MKPDRKRGWGGERERERERERESLRKMRKVLDSPVATASRAVSQWLASELPQRYSPDWMDGCQESTIRNELL